MSKPGESQMTISCLQCDWSVETVNSPAQDARDAAARRDPGMQTGFLDRSRREH